MTPIALLPGLLLAVAAQSDYDYVSECPEENGFFADALQCDRYYECSDGEVRVSNLPSGPLSGPRLCEGVRALLS